MDDTIIQIHNRVVRLADQVHRNDQRDLERWHAEEISIYKDALRAIADGRVSPIEQQVAQEALRAADIPFERHLA